MIETDDTKYENDEEKINQLFEIPGVHTSEGYEALRIGKRNPNYNRIIKIDVRNKANRDKIVNLTKRLKDKETPWNNIYIKKDLRQALAQENNRLRFKMKKLKNLEENDSKTIKIENGKLKIDDVIVDQNLFFR